jgi:hypothetical protein
MPIFNPDMQVRDFQIHTYVIKTTKMMDQNREIDPAIFVMPKK